MKFNKTSLLKIISLTFVLFVYIFLSVKDLYKDVINPDGINWHTRTQEFTKALYGGDYGKTFQAYHPGTTLMWISGPALGLFRSNIAGDLSADAQKFTFLERDYYAKLSLVIFCTALFVINIFLLWKISGYRFALFFSVIYTLEPFVIGMRRLYHLDFLMTALIFTSFLLLIYFNYKAHHWLTLFFSGLFIALALLTKSTAIIFLPAVPFIFLLGNTGLIKKLLGLLLFLASTALFIYAFFPPIWKNPVESAPKYFEKIAFGVSGIGMEGKKEIGSSGKAENITLDDTLEDKGDNFYLVSLVMRLSPAATILLVISLAVFIYYLMKSFAVLIYNSIKSKAIPKAFQCPNDVWLAFWSFGFSLASIIGMSLAQKKSDRYEILVYPFLFLIAAYMINKLKWYLSLPLIIAYIVLAGIEVKQMHPYYLSYSNPYLGGVEMRMRALDGPPFGVASYEVFNVIKNDMKNNGYEGFYTIAGSKSIKAISVGGKFSRFPSCVTDYVVSYGLEENPIYTCSRKYTLIDTVKIGNFDYWYIYKRENQKHESNYD